MTNLDDDEKRRLFQTLDLHTRQNEAIDRGLYGDKVNKVKGALDRIEAIELWITKHNLKTAYVSGATATAMIAAKMFWDWMVEKMKHQ